MKSQTHSFETEWQSLQTSFRIWGITRTWIVFCNFFESYQPTSMDLQISKVGNYLILQLKCFVNHTSDSIKDNTKFHCIKTLFVPPFVDEVSFYKKSNLTAATIQDLLIEDIIQYLLNSPIHLDFSLMMQPSLGHLWRK